MRGYRAVRLARASVASRGFEDACEGWGGTGTGTGLSRAFRLRYEEFTSRVIITTRQLPVAGGVHWVCPVTLLW